MKYTVEKKSNGAWYVYFGSQLICGPYKKKDAVKVADLMNQGMNINQANEQVLGV